MPKLVNNRHKLKATPGTCTVKANGSFSTNVDFEATAMKGKISFSSNAGTWMQLIDCSGKGKIIGTASSILINGENAVLKTDKGMCNGTGTDPSTGAKVPCICKIAITDAGQTSIEKS